MKRQVLGIKVMALVNSCDKNIFDKVLFDEGVLRIANIDGTEIEIEVMEYDICNEDEEESSRDELTALPRIV